MKPWSAKELGDMPPLCGVTKVEAGGFVWHLRPMGSLTKDRLITKYRTFENDPEQIAGITAEMVLACLCEADGTRIQLDDKQAAQFKEIDCTLLEQLAERAQQISGFGDGASRAAEKN